MSEHRGRYRVSIIVDVRAESPEHAQQIGVEWLRASRAEHHPHAMSVGRVAAFKVPQPIGRTCFFCGAWS